MNGTMTEGIDLKGRKSLEPKCGAGSTEKDLPSKGAVLTGLDISPVLMKTFKDRQYRLYAGLQLR